LHVLVTDAGSNPVAVRAALLELAAVWIQAGNVEDPLDSSSSSGCSNMHAAASITDPTAAARTAAVLRAAQATAAQVCKLLLDSHSLQPVQNPSSSLPAWLFEQLRGHEQLQLAVQQEAAAAAAAVAAGSGGKAASTGGAAGHTLSSHSTGIISSSSTAAFANTAPSATGKQQTSTEAPATVAAPPAGSSPASLPTVPDAVLGRLAVCTYVQLLAAMNGGAAGSHQQQRAAEQVLLLQHALRTACPRFAADCCWQGVPSEVSAALQQQQHAGVAPGGGPALPALQAGEAYSLSGSSHQWGQGLEQLLQHRGLLAPIVLHVALRTNTLYGHVVLRWPCRCCCAAVVPPGWLLAGALQLVLQWSPDTPGHTAGP
jgi:hypothetical protein